MVESVQSAHWWLSSFGWGSWIDCLVLVLRLADLVWSYLTLRRCVISCSGRETCCAWQLRASSIDERRNAMLAEMAKVFLKTRLFAFLNSRTDDPVAVSYWSDIAPFTTRERYRLDSGSVASVIEDGRRVDCGIQQAWAQDLKGIVSAFFYEPLRLIEKSTACLSGAAKGRCSMGLEYSSQSLNTKHDTLGTRRAACFCAKHASCGRARSARASHMGIYAAAREHAFCAKASFSFSDETACQRDLKVHTVPLVLMPSQPAQPFPAEFQSGPHAFAWHGGGPWRHAGLVPAPEGSRCRRRRQPIFVRC